MSDYFYLIFMFVLLIIILYRKSIKYYIGPYYRASGKRYSSIKKNIGDYGEYVVFNNLLRIRGKKAILSNLYIKSKNGNYTEIDVVMINTSGIFVVESKNFKGFISGYSSSQMWTQSLGKSHKNKFYSPVLQNSTHIRAIRNVLNCDISNLHSVIAFNSHSDLSGVSVDPNTAILTTIDNINGDLRDIIHSNRKSLTKSQVSEYYNCLRKFSHAPRSVKNTHLKQVKAKQLQNK